MFHHTVIAGKLQIPVKEEVHGPYKRVEPVKAQRDKHHQLGRQVKATNMGKFVIQHVVKLSCIIPVRVFRKQNDRVEDAVGQWRGNLVGLPKVNIAFQRMLF